MKNIVYMRSALLSGASLVAVGLMISAVPANAQQQVESVTVTGIRASLQSAQSIKQNSDQVVDSITSVDIGALPDRNIAEALQRVPGVTLQRNDAPSDLTRMGSTGNSVFIRGLSWVKSLVNGHDEFTAVAGRTLSFADVSADLMSAVNVYKSPTASQIEGGVGGTVDLITRKPFDHDGQLIAFSGDYTYGDLVDAARPSANALYSNRWNTKLGEIGVLASVDWQDQINRTDGVNVDQSACWNKTATASLSAGSAQKATDSSYGECMALALGSGRLMGPKSWAWRQMEFAQQRLASNLVVQWRPTEKLEITAFAMNTYAHNRDTEHYVNNSISYSQLTAGKFNNNVWVGGPASVSSIDVRGGSGHNRNSDLSLNVKYTPIDALEITADFQFVESSSPYRNMTYFTSIDSAAAPIMTLNYSGDTPGISAANASGSTSAANYYWSAAMDHLQYNSAHSANARLDASYKFQGTGLFGVIKSAEAGFRSEQKLAYSRSTSYNWGMLTSNWVSSDGYVTLDGTLHCSTAPCKWEAADGNTYTSATGGLKTALSQAELFSYNRVLGNAVPSLWVPKASLAAMNTFDSNKIMLAVEPAASTMPSWAVGDQNWAQWVSYAKEHGCTGDDVTCLAAYNNTPGGASSGNTKSKQNEQTYAGYFQLNYGVDTFFGYDVPIDGNIGLRVVRTEDTVNAGLLVLPYLGHSGTCVVGTGAGQSTSCDDWNKAYKYLGGSGSAYEGVTVTRPAVQNGYTSVLPSFNFRAKVSETVQARLAYSETILRPDFSYTYSGASLAFNFEDSNGPKYGVYKSDPSGFGGNPYLKPMHASNYDGSIEWYFSPSGSITVSLFHKDLSNYIYTATTTMPITDPVSSQTTNFLYTTYVNGDKGKVEGFELSYQQFYDSLPGFWSGLGLQANYTKIYNSGGHNAGTDITSSVAIAAAADKTLPLEGMSNDSYNIALLYAKYDIDARLAWNWRSHYLSSSSDANNKIPVWLENYGQLDGSVFYSFWEHYKVGVQVTNITGSVFYTDMGYKDFHPRTNTIENDRKYSFVIRTNF